MLKRNQPVTIRYTSKTGETTVRAIVPTVVPVISTVKAIDVTDVEASEVSQLVESLDSYNRYVEHKSSQILSYESWLDNSQSTVQSIKWRSFKVNGIEVV